MQYVSQCNYSVLSSFNQFCHPHTVKTVLTCWPVCAHAKLLHVDVLKRCVAYACLLQLETQYTWANAAWLLLKCNTCMLGICFPPFIVRISVMISSNRKLLVELVLFTSAASCVCHICVFPSGAKKKLTMNTAN